MADSPLTKRLLIKPGFRIRLIAPPEGYEAMLQPLPEGAAVVDPTEQPTDFVQVFTTDRESFDRLVPAAIVAVRPDGILWVSYPKLTSTAAADLSRDVIWELGKSLGWHPVTQISIDETWSALRFRPD